MKPQSYHNHTMWYIPHHFIFYPVNLVLMGGCLYHFFILEDTTRWIWLFLAVVFFMVMWLSFMLRQHYTLTLQNRLIVEEVNFRYFSLSGKRLSQVAPHFNNSQLYALRFASDEEMVDLVDQALKNNWTGDHIKKHIKNWKADERRV